ncbi:MAG TPA: GtrA family protein [Candidatus Nanoarchaeia archaeon]|nr:GtrA family protein [Candidatus Nanoarchaeia archaeon]
MQIDEFYRYFKFIVGGGISLLIALGITYALTEIIGLWHMLSFGIALLIEIIFLFFYHSVVTFKKRGKFWLFMSVILFISNLNWILVYITTVFWQWNYLASIVLVALMVSVLNYLINKTLVFRK